MDIQRPQIATGGYRIPTQEELDGEPIVQSSSESTAAAFDLAMQDTAVMIGQRLFSISELENQTKKKLTPDEANEMYPDMDVPFREDINPYVAQLQHDRLQEKRNLEQKIANGPSDAWTKSKQFGAGFVAHMMDPVEFGAGALTGWGVGGLIGRTAWGARLAGSTTRAGKLAFDVVEAGSGNLIENLASEGALSIAETREGVEYDPAQGLLNVAMSTFIGTGVGVAIKQGAKGLSESEFFFNKRKRILDQTSPEADIALARTTIGNLENDIKADATPLLETLARETDVKPQDYGLPPFDYAELMPEDAFEKQFFASAKNSVSTLADGKKVPIADDYGLGTQITDNPAVANAAASRTLSDSTGSVHEMKIKGELRPVRLEQPVPENLQNFVNKHLEYLGVKPDEISTMKDALDVFEDAIDSGDFDASFKADLKKELMAGGYNALVSNGTSRLGIDHSPHNAVTVLDDSILEQTKAYTPNKRIVRPPDDATVKKLASRDFRSHTLVDEQKYDDFIRKAKEADGPEVQSEFAKEMTETFEEFDGLAKQGLLDANEIKALDNLKKVVKDSETNWTLLKAAKSCVGL